MTAKSKHSKGPLQLAIQGALGQDKQRKLPFQITHVFCWPRPRATVALQRGGFVPRTG